MNQDYHSTRAQQELELGRRARTNAASAAHFQLAALHMHELRSGSLADNFESAGSDQPVPSGHVPTFAASGLPEITIFGETVVPVRGFAEPEISEQ